MTSGDVEKSRCKVGSVDFCEGTSINHVNGLCRGVGTALIGGAQSHIIHRFSPYMVIGDTMYGEIQ